MRENAGTGFLRNLIDPARIEYGVASSAVIGAVALVDPARLTAGGRLAFRGLTALVTGALVLVELRRDAAFTGNPAARFGVVAGVVGASFGLSELGERADRGLVDALRRRGVRRPRLALAVASAAVAAVAFRVGRTVGGEPAADDSGDWPRIATVDPAVRTLVDGMLAATDGHGSAELRTLWATARLEIWSEEDAEREGAFSRWLEFATDEDLPRAVPHDATFPVRARFVSGAGVPVEAFLLVLGGRPRSLVIDVVPDTPELAAFDDGDPLDDVTAWPARDAVTFVLDTA